MRKIALVAAPTLLAAAANCQTFFPPPPAPAANQVTTEKALLGMSLFWDEQLSTDNNVACGTCHSFAKGGTEGRSMGVNPGPDGLLGTSDDIHASSGVATRAANGTYTASSYGVGAAQVTPRKAPSMINIAYQNKMFYDGRARDGDFRDPITNVVMATGATALENLILQPPLNPIEMGHPGRTWAEITQKIAGSTPLRLADQIPSRLQSFIQGSNYPDLFQRAFGTREVTPTRIVFAIATYVRTLVSDQSRFDFVLGGSGTLTTEEARGRQLFEQSSGTFGSVSSCMQCHGDLSRQAHVSGPSATATTMYGQTPTGNFHNTGVRPISEDPGSGAVTNTSTDQGRFKVPFLRNVALHQRFFHNGQFTTLSEVMDFYERGGDFHVNQAPEIQPRTLTAADKQALVAFMNTLTDPRVAAGLPPFESPRLGSERQGLRPVQVGTPTAGTGTPSLVARDPLFAGNQNVSLAVTGVPTNTLTALVWDVALIPGGTNVLGPTLYVGATAPHLVLTGISQPTGTGSGFASVKFAIPNLPRLVGSSAYTQWLALDPNAPGGIAASSAIRLDIF